MIHPENIDHVVHEHGPEGMALDAAWKANEAWDTIKGNTETLTELQKLQERSLPGVTIDAKEIDRLEGERHEAQASYPGYVALAGSIFHQPKGPKRTSEGTANAELDDAGEEVLGVTNELQYYLQRPVTEFIDDQLPDSEHTSATRIKNTLEREKIYTTQDMLMRGLKHSKGVSEMRTIGSKQTGLLKAAVAGLDPDLEWFDAPGGTLAAKLYSSLADVRATTLWRQASEMPEYLDLNNLSIVDVAGMSVRDLAKLAYSRETRSTAQVNGAARAAKQAATAFKNDFEAERRSILEAHQAAQNE